MMLATHALRKKCRYVTKMSLRSGCYFKLRIDEYSLPAYEIAKRLGLKHVTYLAVFKVDEFRDVPHFAAKLAVEGALREYGVPYTILRPPTTFRTTWV